MKKRIITIMLAMTMAVGLAACGSASGSSTDSKNSSDTESTEISKSSDDSKSDTSSKSVPTEVTEDNISDFPVTDESEFELVTDSKVCLSLSSTGGYDYEEDIPDGECAIMNYTGSDKVVVIPEEIDGKKVTYLANAAFFHKDTIEGVYVPDTVRAIGEMCFQGDDNLTVVRLSENLEKSFTDSFISLKSITLPASYNYMPSYENAVVTMFNGTVYLENGISDEFASWLEANNKYKNGEEAFKVVRK